MIQTHQQREFVPLPVSVAGIYDWLYSNKDVYSFLDNDLFVNFITLGFHKKLVDSLLKEIKPNSHVLQLGCTFGLQMENVAYQIDEDGTYTIIDNNNKQIKRCLKKYEFLFNNMKFKFADAANFKIEQKFDCVICYNLLHELPPLSKVNVVCNALNSLNSGGKAIFIDYHNPAKYHPLRYFMRMFNRLYQPFAEKLWERSIDSYAQNVNVADYTWTKTTFGLGMYQKVVATKRNLLNL